MKKREQGVLSVEASIVLTLMLLFILFLFGFGRVYRAQNLVSHASLQTADAVAMESYLRETALQSDASDVVYLANHITDSSSISVEGLESLRSANLPKIARQKFIAAIASSEAKADEKLKSMGVKDGVAGIDFSECKMDLGNDDVIIAVKYTIEMQFPVFGYNEIAVTKAAKAKTFGEILFEVSTKPNNPGWGSTSGDRKVVHGTEVEIAATPNYGYKFVSWSDGNTENPRKVTVTDAQNYIAIFERDSFGINISKKINYNQNYKGINHTNYGSFEGAGNYLYLDNAVLTATPAEPNYLFEGWDIDGDGVIDNKNQTITITVDKTYNNIKAVFKPALCKVTTKVNNSKYGSAAVKQGSKEGTTIEVEYGSKVELIAVAKDSVRFLFEKWSNNSTSASTKVNVESSITYEAIFIPNTYTVTFYNGSEKLHSTEVICNSSIDGSKSYINSTMCDSSKISNFGRWKNLDGDTFTSETVVSSNMDVYAAQNCKITLDANGGSVSWTSKTIERDSSITLPKPEWSGHTFKGWNGSNGKSYDANSYTFSGDVKLTAKWSCNHSKGELIEVSADVYCRDIYYGGSLIPGANLPHRKYRCNDCGETWQVTDESLRKHYRMNLKDGYEKDDFHDHCDTIHPDTRENAYCGKFTGNSGKKHDWDGHYHILCSYCHKEEQGTVWCYVDGELKWYNLHLCALHGTPIGKWKCPV